jgi:uncharacterized protein (TIRG00374 family)
MRRSAVIKAAVTATLLSILLWRTDFGAVAASLRELRFGSWLLNFVLFLGAWTLAAVKWKVLLRDQPFATLLKLNFIGQYYAMLLPGQIAGEAVKAYRLGKGKVDADRIAASVIIDRITSSLGLLLIALYGISLSGTQMKKQILLTLLAAVLVLLLGLFSFHLPGWSRLLNAAERRLPRFARLVGQVRRLLLAWKSYVETPALMLLSILLGALFQLIAVWINFRIGRDLGLNISFADWCWVFGVVSIVVTLPFTVAGLGLREGSFLGTLALLGVAPERAIAHSFALFSLLLAGAIVGAACEWSRRLTLPDTTAMNSQK